MWREERKIRLTKDSSEERELEKSDLDSAKLRMCLFLLLKLKLKEGLAKELQEVGEEEAEVRDEVETDSSENFQLESELEHTKVSRKTLKAFDTATEHLKKEDGRELEAEGMLEKLFVQIISFRFDRNEKLRSTHLENRSLFSSCQRLGRAFVNQSSE